MKRNAWRRFPYLVLCVALCLLPFLLLGCAGGEETEKNGVNIAEKAKNYALVHYINAYSEYKTISADVTDTESDGDVVTVYGTVSAKDHYNKSWKGTWSVKMVKNSGDLDGYSLVSSNYGNLSTSKLKS